MGEVLGIFSDDRTRAGNTGLGRFFSVVPVSSSESSSKGYLVQSSTMSRQYLSLDKSSGRGPARCTWTSSGGRVVLGPRLLIGVCLCFDLMQVSQLFPTEEPDVVVRFMHR